MKEVRLVGNNSDMTVRCESCELDKGFLIMKKAHKEESPEDVQEEFYMNLKYIDIVTVNEVKNEDPDS